MSDKYKIPNSIAKQRAYSWLEFSDLKGAANRQERLLAAVLDCREDKLTERDQKYLELLQLAFKIMAKELSPKNRRRKVEKLLGINSRGRALQVMNDVEAIFCDIDEQTSNLNRTIFEHKLSRLIEKLEKKDIESPSLPRLYTLLAKVQGLDIHQENQVKYEPIPIPQYTFDPNAIASAEDIPHEEITNE